MAKSSTRFAEPLVAVAESFRYGHTTSESFKLQLVATIVGLSNDELLELAEIIVECHQ